MSFVQRLLDVQFQMPQGTFANTGSSTATLSGLRVSAEVITAGIPQTQLNLTIYGMPLSMMQQLATFGITILQGSITRNTVTVLAGDATNGVTSTVFSAGNITSAYIDFDSAPNVGFKVEAYAPGADAVSMMAPTTFSSPTNAATAIQQIAGQMNGGQGYPVVNNGVNTMLGSGGGGGPYFWGSPLSQLLQAVQASNIYWSLEGGTIYIWPKNGSNGTTPTLVSPETGMIQYPSFNAKGIVVRTIYNPNIKRGSQIMVESTAIPTQDVQNSLLSSQSGMLQIPADGIWNVYSVNHRLDSQVPKGLWESTLLCQSPGNPVPTTPT